MRIQWFIVLNLLTLINLWPPVRWVLGWDGDFGFKVGVSSSNPTLSG